MELNKDIFDKAIDIKKKYVKLLFEDSIQNPENIFFGNSNLEIDNVETFEGKTNSYINIFIKSEKNPVKLIGNRCFYDGTNLLFAYSSYNFINSKNKKSIIILKCSYEIYNKLNRLIKKMKNNDNKLYNDFEFNTINNMENDKLFYGEYMKTVFNSFPRTIKPLRLQNIEITNTEMEILFVDRNALEENTIVRYNYDNGKTRLFILKNSEILIFNNKFAYTNDIRNNYGNKLIIYPLVENDQLLKFMILNRNED